MAGFTLSLRQVRAGGLNYSKLTQTIYPLYCNYSHSRSNYRGLTLLLISIQSTI